MPPRVRLFFSALSVVLFLVAATPLYRELSRPAACGAMVTLFILVATGRLTYRGEQQAGAA